MGADQWDLVTKWAHEVEALAEAAEAIAGACGRAANVAVKSDDLQTSRALVTLSIRCSSLGRRLRLLSRRTAGQYLLPAWSEETKSDSTSTDKASSTTQSTNSPRRSSRKRSSS